MKVKFSSLSRRLGNDKVYYDKSFQRRVVWSKEDLNKYLQAATRGWTSSSSITLACVDSCLEYSIEKSDDYSRRYFEDKQKKGYKYISIDGQNRTKKVIDFMNGKETVSGTNFIDADNNEIDKIVNLYISQLPNRLRDHLKDCSVNVNVHKEITREDCAKIFRNINSTEPPNAQNLRQSRTTPIAGWVRNISKKYPDLTTSIFNEKAINKMLDDEHIAKTAMVITNNYNHDLYKRRAGTIGLSKSEIDKWYELGEGIYSMDDARSPYDHNTLLNRTEKIISMASMVFKNRGKKTIPNKSIYWAIIFACEWVFDNNYIIDNHADFYDQVVKEDSYLCDKSNMEYQGLRKSKLKVGLDPDVINKYDYYHIQTTLPHMENYRNKRKKELTKSFMAKTSFFSIKKVINESEAV